MNDRKFSNMTEAMEYLDKLGYSANFVLENGKLRNPKNEELFTPADMVIHEIYRFEGDSNPEDMSVVYAVEAQNGTRGTIIDAFGTYADLDVGKFVKRIPTDLRDNEVVPNVLPSE